MSARYGRLLDRRRDHSWASMLRRNCVCALSNAFVPLKAGRRLSLIIRPRQGPEQRASEAANNMLATATVLACTT